MSFVDITVSGGSLDSYLNSVDQDLSHTLDNLSCVDVTVIPSPHQREAFEYLVKLLGWATSFTGSLRYDVQTSHEDCPEHDEHVARKLARAREALGA